MYGDYSCVCEVFIDGEWQIFDAQGADTEKSRQVYAKAFKPFAKGSFPVRYNGVVNNNSSSDTVFYKRI